ncbi:MAG: DnaJ domain-containing protein [Myxococcota bacterium]|nr:DnaJ domain-containing protein [Myxococcota bacterium]
MASAGEPPALPETDDPYELLNVSRDADEAAVKKAYARLVRVYRPDKSPREFQRVHAAFEIVRARGESRLPVLPPVVHVEVKPRVDDQQVATQLSARIAEAGESLERRWKVLDDLLAERVPLDLVFAREELRDAAVRHHSLTWSRLAESSSDLAAVQAAWEGIWSYAFVHDRHRAAALLDDERLRRDAGDHLHIAMSCVDRLAALSWLHSFDERRLARLLREACPISAPWLSHELDAIELDFVAARALRDRDWPEPLHLFVRLAVARRIYDQDRRAQLARQLRESMTADLESTWVTFEKLAKETSLQPFYEVIYEALPVEYIRLDGMEKERFERLTAVLEEAGASPLTWKIRGGVAAGAAALGVLGWVPSAIFLGGAVTFGLATETMRYRRQIRSRIAKAILDVPVTSSVVHRWILLNGKLAGRLTRYTPGIDNDVALRMFSMLVAYADVAT